MPGPAAAVIPAGRLAGVAWSERRSLMWLLILILGAPLALIALIVAIFGGIAGTLTAPGVSTYAPSPFALRDIPPAYLRLYQEAAITSGLGWEYLAAIGKIETDHGRSLAPGSRSGENHAGAGGPMQFLQATFDAYAVDGNNDGRKSRYDPEDAIPSAANYLKASGAPGDWDRALFAYNHAGWYVDAVQKLAKRLRGAPLGPTGIPAGSGESQALPIGAPWLERVRGTKAVCDRRIVPDVVLLLTRYKMTAGECFAMTGHSMKGEHPLGLGIDLYPAPHGSWELLGKAARDLGWNEGCAYTGCAGQLPAPLRFIGWNGYRDGNHGDPAHVGDNAHLHLSWQHTPSLPGTPAARVQTLLAPRPVAVSQAPVRQRRQLPGAQRQAR